MEYLLTEEEITAVNARMGGTRIRSLLETQVEKVLRMNREELDKDLDARVEKAVRRLNEEAAKKGPVP